MTSLTSDDKTYELLIGKVRSKIDTAKFFSGFISIMLGITLKDLLATANASTSSLYWLVAGVVLIVFSVCCSVSALFAYDRLLMPPTFWSGSKTTDTINKNIQFHMVRAWHVYFMPSVVAFFLGLVAIGVASVNENLRWLIGVVLIGAILVALLIYQLFKAPFEFKD